MYLVYRGRLLRTFEGKAWSADHRRVVAERHLADQQRAERRLLREREAEAYLQRARVRVAERDAVLCAAAESAEVGEIGTAHSGDDASAAASASQAEASHDML
jgi:hypothetical protein